MLFNEAEASEPAAAQANAKFTEVKSHKRKVGGRKPFPKEIPREEIVHDIPEAEKICACGATREKIGEETTEKLDIIPAKIMVIRHIRPKYCCKKCLSAGQTENAFRIADNPPEILPKSIATAGLFAHVLTNKFCDHLPYHRQEKIFQRHGIDISRANLSNWQIQFYERFDRLEDFFWRDLLQSKVILADETPLQVLQEKDRKNVQKSYMFAFASDKIRFFQYRETRSVQFLAERFREYRGVLATDGFKSYDTLCRDLQIEHASCWAHVRRKFVEIMKLMKADSFAHQIVEDIRKLYAIEARCREKAFQEEFTLQQRQENSRQIVDQIFERLKAKQSEVPESLPLGEAIRYALGQESKLRVFLENSHVPIDTNVVENAIRPFVVGRKNWLFSGSPRGADSSALIYSLIETAKANNLEPWMYLRYLFEKLPLCKSDEEMQALLPHRLAPAVLG
jgi:transposase